MPTLIRIGVNEYNTSRITRRGYVIVRSKNEVLIRYGAIDLIKAKYYWVGWNLPRVERRRFRSVERATDFMRKRVSDQLSDKKSGKYIKLPPRVRIRSYRRNPRRYL